MAVCELTFEEELELVETADESEHAEIALRLYLLPLVKEAIEVYGRPGARESDLIAAGYTYFDFAIHRYLTRIEELQFTAVEPFKFSTYFNWFIRQGVLAQSN